MVKNELKRPKTVKNAWVKTTTMSHGKVTRIKRNTLRVIALKNNVFQEFLDSTNHRWINFVIFASYCDRS